MHNIIIFLLVIFCIFILLKIGSSPKHKHSKGKVVRSSPEYKHSEDKVLCSSPEYKRGEDRVHEILERMTRANECALHNLFIPAGNGYTEIDSLYITKKALFIVESKSFYGNIYGSTDDEKWHNINESENKEFYNPIKQNENHLKFVNKALRCFIPIYSIITFCDVSDLSNLKISGLGRKIFVINDSQLERTIRNIVDKEEDFIRDRDYNLIVSQFKNYRDNSGQKKKIVQEHIKSKYGE